MPHRDGCGAGTIEGWLTRKHLVEHACQRILIGGRSNVLLGLRLLRTEIPWRPDGDAARRESLRVNVADHACNSEIDHARALRGEDDVFGLDVAVDNVAIVRALKRLGDLLSDTERTLDFELPFALNARTQCFAIEIVHDEEQPTVGFPAVVDGDDVRVLQGGRDADLGLKASNADFAGERGVKHLDRDRPLEPKILSAIHGSHATVSELVFEPIVISQRVLERSEPAYHSLSSSLNGSSGWRGRYGTTGVLARVVPGLLQGKAVGLRVVEGDASSCIRDV